MSTTPQPDLDAEDWLCPHCRTTPGVEDGGLAYPGALVVTAHRVPEPRPGGGFIPSCPGSLRLAVRRG